MRSTPSFDEVRVLVVGDVMLDRYWHGDTARISPEAPVPVVAVSGEERRLGGAANVARNLARIGASVRLVGVVGDDESGGYLRELLEREGVASELCVSRSHPSIAKLRVVSRNQQLLRLDFEQSLFDDDAFDRQALLAAYRGALAQADIVICSDYGKGTLVDIPAMIDAARTKAIPVLVDPKGLDWTRYTGASVVTPNWHELARVTAVDLCEDNLDDQVNALRESLALDAVLLTRSQNGVALFSARETVTLPAQAKDVYDVTGAGDTIIALLAACMGAGLSLVNAAGVANIAAGIVVGKLGTASVSAAELEQAVRASQGESGIFDEPALLERVAHARALGERIVFTNGCFDLLHPGHIGYLEAARALGDWLIVAVNDDASVRRLKGSSRPLNDVSHRMQVLSGLSAVDWVVPFSEDTPERLIRAIRPDVLAKGGDYRPEAVIGADIVRAHGGEVRVLDFRAGFSTTSIIERMTAPTDQSQA